MHKLSKGLKKKIKGKKGKEKEDDLFDPGELERHRREQAAAAASENRSESGSSEASQAKPKAESEEWRQFLSLTAGVDSILQKTQEDLSRIKATSYYQRNKKPETPTEASEPAPAASVKPKWVGFEEGQQVSEEEETTPSETTNPKEPHCEPEPEDQPPNEEESDHEEEVDEDIFDTTFVEIVTSGEVKLVHVPDSPVGEKSCEEDPFDTSTVEKLIGPLPEVKKKKNLVSIGKAAEVLARQAPFKSLERVAPKRPETIELISCFDEPLETQAQTLSLGNSASSPKSNKELPVSEGSSKISPDIKDILAEFDSIIESRQADVKHQEPESDDDEFDALAHESLTKQKALAITPSFTASLHQSECDDPFDTTAVEQVLQDSSTNTAQQEPGKPLARPARPAPPSKSPAARPAKPPPPAITKAQSHLTASITPETSAVTSELQENLTEEYDPFDTHIADGLIAGESENSSDPFETRLVSSDPENKPTAVHENSLTVESTETQEDDFDPFDTSVAEKILPTEH